MNRAYRLVWNERLSACVAAPEISRCKTGRAGWVCGGAALLCALSGLAHALPAGGQVSAGQGSIAGSGGTMTISQQSQNLSVNWQSFNIASGESVNFVQPSASAIALNRVLGLEPSQIYGKLSSNGQVWLLNQNGILFGSTAQVNVGGLVASTLNIGDADFLSGKRTFTGSGGTVVNRGSITAADGGYVAMLGGKVSNEGVIQARLGTVALGGGSRVSLDFAGDRLINLQVDQGVIDALAQNKQLIQADGGTVLLSASAVGTLLHAVVNNTGVIQARSIDDSGGTIRLVADKEGGTTEIGGTLDASAPNGGNGGFIETSGAHVHVADNAVITAAAPFGAAGTWLIDPTDFNIAASGGDISGSALGSELNMMNVTILSGNGATPGVGDINLNDAVTWNSANGLTLSALHSVNVAQPVANAGTGGVTLRADNAGTCVAGASGCGTVAFSGAGHVTLNGGMLSIYYNPAGSSNAADANGSGPSYANPTDYSGTATLGNGSTLTAWMLVNDVNQLQGIATNLQGDYALGRNVDASATSTWNGGAGFVPIGSIGALAFSGRLDGLGHVISGLTIERPEADNVGLFGVTADGARLSNLSLTGATISGYQYVGQLVGANSGVVADSFGAGLVFGFKDVGGLVGTNAGTILRSGNNGTVQGLGVAGSDLDTNENGNVGGLVGSNRGSISSAYSTGLVTGTNDVGGLVGHNRGTISDVRSSATVVGTNDVGGLVGDNEGIIAKAHSSGDVNGSLLVGGLVGTNDNTIADSDATGAVAGTGVVGGLVGHDMGNISNSHSSGSVSGDYYVGGLAGTDDTGDRAGPGVTAGTIESSYATGAVSGREYVGGLLGGGLLATVSNSFSSGAVHGIDYVGGLVGYMAGGTIAGSHATGSVTAEWDFGGLVGWNSAAINSSYATGNLSWPVPDIANIMGGLVGENYGPITDSYATGNVLGSSSAGGLVGINYAGATITRSYATGTVLGRDSGGLVGGNAGDIVDSYATGNVGGGALVGGLAGANSGDIVRSHASGDVSATALGGGLVGLNSGTITASYATGDVHGGDEIGGLVGANEGTISASYATGTVTSNGGNPYGVGYGDDVGGLVGINSGTVTMSYATGDVSSRYGSSVGGLVGLNVAGESVPTSTGVLAQPGSISDSYATGSVSGVDSVGGLVGSNLAGGPFFIPSITTSYSTGAVSGVSNVGGLVGTNTGTVTDSYWDITTSGQKTSAGGTGLRDKQMMRARKFVGFDFVNIWTIQEGSGYPTLRVF